MTIRLLHAPSESVIILEDEKGAVMGSKYYTRRIHKYQSESDYKRLSTELQTYGYSHGLLPEWERIPVFN